MILYGGQRIIVCPVYGSEHRRAVSSSISDAGKDNWDPDKNEILKTERGISFEEIVFHIVIGDEVDLFEHPNQERYPGQMISVVIVEGYAYLVPNVES